MAAKSSRSQRRRTSTTCLRPSSARPSSAVGTRSSWRSGTVASESPERSRSTLRRARTATRSPSSGRRTFAWPGRRTRPVSRRGSSSRSSWERPRGYRDSTRLATPGSGSTRKQPIGSPPRAWSWARAPSPPSPPSLRPRERPNWITGSNSPAPFGASRPALDARRHRPDHPRYVGPPPSRPLMFDSLLVIIVAGLVGPILAAGRRPLLPAVVGELIAGIAIGRSGLNLIDATTPANGLLYGLGFAMLMLVAGSHVDLGAPSLRAGARAGVLAAAVVALLAVPVGLAIGATLAPGTPPLLIPVLLAGSSAAVAFPILQERGLIGPGVALLLVWIPLADALTVLIMPLTLIGAAKIPEALGGDALIVVCTVVALWLGERVARSQPALTLRDRSRTRGWALQLPVT